ncbi:MAG: YggS family pyridoxal phosphate-dependent enzyme [Anaerolineae bacterium]|nr:YggS family pyridoxal phosphate-dependent enzyme [Anaerolineae bacterium]NIN95302.1 YggS family pyridoxal phosphate-dependent enzyme [Anaerolineae bacterium]NIQ78267.1 YggS family pyridoxal phosphate-dependent enzyme [Anaerolineae bacterium]
MIDLQTNLAHVKGRIAAAATRVGRDPDEITLVAVTKTFAPEIIQGAWNAGLREFGENRLQEAEPKITLLREKGLDLNWHMVGHLQRNKVKKAIGLFDIIQSVDSVRLAREISRRCRAKGTSMPMLLEVNVSGESSKYGFRVQEANSEQEDQFLDAVEQMAELPHLDVQGLMTMAPLDAPEEVLRSCFRSLRTLFEKLKEDFPELKWRHLSMGMTDDFEVAIEEGATMIRVGRAIFGERKHR